MGNGFMEGDIRKSDIKPLNSEINILFHAKFT